MTKITDVTTLLTLDDLPEDAIVRIDPDFEAPGIEWVKRDGPKIKPFETSEVITGVGLTVDLERNDTPTMEFVDSSLSLYHSQPTSMVTVEPNNNFVITGDNGEELVCIDMGTGKTTIGPEYAPDEAARVFWKCIEQHKQPDAWEENNNITSTEILRELRDIVGCKEGEDILAVVREFRLNPSHEPYCNWHKWDHTCSWSNSDCTCDTRIGNKITGLAAPGCLDDMPKSYFDNSIKYVQTGETLGELEDLTYFQQKLQRALKINPDADVRKLEKQIELLEDAVVIYKEHRPSDFKNFDNAMKVID